MAHPTGCIICSSAPRPCGHWRSGCISIAEVAAGRLKSLLGSWRISRDLIVARSNYALHLLINSNALFRVKIALWNATIDFPSVTESHSFKTIYVADLKQIGGCLCTSCYALKRNFIIISECWLYRNFGGCRKSRMMQRSS